MAEQPGRSLSSPAVAARAARPIERARRRRRTSGCPLPAVNRSEGRASTRSLAWAASEPGSACPREHGHGFSFVPLATRARTRRRHGIPAPPRLRGCAVVAGRRQPRPWRSDPVTSSLRSAAGRCCNRNVGNQRARCRVPPSSSAAYSQRGHCAAANQRQRRRYRASHQCFRHVELPALGPDQTDDSFAAVDGRRRCAEDGGLDIAFAVRLQCAWQQRRRDV